MAEERKQIRYIGEFELSKGMGIRGEFTAASDLEASSTCVSVADRNFPHVVGWALIEKETSRLVCHVKTMAALHYFGNMINAATKSVVTPIFKMISEEKFKDFEQKNIEGDAP